MPDRLDPAYRAVLAVSTPIIRGWGRLEVTGLEHVPAEGPVLMAGNHDSYWDPVAVGVALKHRRQVHALAKSTLWKPGLAWVLDSMGQIPIERGAGDARALQRAIEALRAGACVGVFPEGTRAMGRTLRARSGLGRLAAAVPEAALVSCTIEGTVDLVRFPTRPHIRVRFFPPQRGPLLDGEEPGALAARILDEIRLQAPIQHAGRRPGAPPPMPAGH
jgi:1-acyl-sn-glycerol-3-phosphate acyltransferase